METKNESPMVRQYRDLKSKHPDAMLLFRCGDFYETYDEDARECAKVLGITLTKRQSDGVPMAGFPHHALDTYLPKLIRTGHHVAICDQLDPPPGPKRKRGETIDKAAIKREQSDACIDSAEREQAQTKFNNSNNQNNSEVMATKKNNNQETKNAANEQQVNNSKSEAVVKQVDVIGLMNGLKKNGTAKLSDYATPIEDAQAEEVENVNVGEMTVDSIMPRMTAEPEAPTKKEVAQAISKAANGGAATTMPLGQHGTLVIGGVPKPTEKPEPVVIDEEVTAKPQVTLRRKVKQTYKSVALPAKNGGEWSKVYGFASEKEAQAMADRLPNSVRATWDYGENQEGRETKTRHYYLRFGVRYLEVAAELADALNQGDKAVVARVVAKAHGVYAGAVADGKAESAAKKAAKGETKPKRQARQATTQPAAPQGKTYTAADMETLVRAMAQAMATAQGADVKDFEPLVQAAMKKAA